MQNETSQYIYRGIDLDAGLHLGLIYTVPYKLGLPHIIDTLSNTRYSKDDL